MGKRLLRWVFNALFALLTDRTLEGAENLPEEGPYILAANHLSILDVPLVFGLLGSEKVTGWAAEKWENHPLIGPLLRLGGGIFIQRGEIDRGALKAAIRWLEAGNVFGMSPEGTRSRTGELIRGKTGIAYLVDATNAPVVPVAIIGSDTGISKLLRLRRPHLTIRVGQPFRLPPIDPKNRPRGLRQNADEVMCRIAALLPERYHGAYADHPRLHALLDSQRELSAASGRSPGRPE
jgi:1-acyl-sn-glycerol-3-phosphate acyltransferase